MLRTGIFCLSMLAVLISGCSMLGTSAKKATPDELFYVFKEQDNRSIKGFMDKTGKIVVGPWRSFEWNGKKYGENDESAFRIMPFIEGLAGICFYDETPVSDEKARCGFIDKTGKIVIEPKYKSISYFSENMAAVSEDGRKYGYIDPAGKIIIEQKFLTNSHFSDGLAVAALTGGDTTKTGYIDKTGKFVIEPKYQLAGSFNDGFAIVLTPESDNLIIDKTGREIKKIRSSSSENSDYYYNSTIYNKFYKAIVRTDF